MCYVSAAMAKGNPNIAKYGFKKGNKIASRNKGKKQKLTQLKEAIGLNHTQKILNQIEKNIIEFLAHKDPKIRLDATKAFTDYYKPRKREHSGEINSNVKVVFENIKND